MELVVAILVGLIIFGYGYLWMKALKRDRDFRKSRPKFEEMLKETGWKVIEYKKISLIEPGKINRTYVWYFRKPCFYRLGNNFIRINRNGFDVYFKEKNPFGSLVWEDQHQIDSLNEDDKEIKLYYTVTFAKRECLIIGK